MDEKLCLLCERAIEEHVTVTLRNYGRKHPGDGLHEWYRVCPSVRPELVALMEKFEHGYTAAMLENWTASINAAIAPDS